MLIDYQLALSKEIPLDWLKEYLLVPFKVLAHLIQNFKNTRDWFAERFAAPKIAALIKGGIVLTFFVWIAIWALAGDEDRNRLTDAVKGMWDSTGKLIDQKSNP